VIPRYPVYLFDIDGTLLESATDICGAIHELLATTSQNDVPEAFLRRYIGRHLNDLFTDLFPKNSLEQNEELTQRYRTLYLGRKHGCTRVYPGVAETLAKLGGRKSTATTKGTPTSRLVLEQFGLLPYFDHVQGTDGFPAKPQPDVIFKSLDLFGVKPHECILVGDSAPDMEAGRRAGVATCAVRYGYGDPDEMARWKPDYWIDRFEELFGPALT
jgi:HAD superfamily hydrolase (TIGR01509 family)